MIGTEADLDLFGDLLVYSGSPGHSEPALVRSARTVRHAAGSDAAVVLAAALHASC